jgi:hypothetical protein
MIRWDDHLLTAMEQTRNARREEKKKWERYFLEEMELASKMDPEAAHARADEILCSALRICEYTKLVAAFERLPKWYA